MDFDRCIPHIGLKVDRHLDFKNIHLRYFNFRQKIRVYFCKKTNKKKKQKCAHDAEPRGSQIS